MNIFLNWLIAQSLGHKCFDFAVATTKGIHLDAQLLKHRHEHITKRRVFFLNILLLWFLPSVPRTALWIRSGAVDVLAVIEPHLFATH